MGRSQRSNGVSWPSDVNLCQVKLFSMKEAPSRVRMKTQKLLQTWSGGDEPDLPPGFEHFHYAKRVEPSKIRLVTWKCPPKFEVKPQWQMVAGEESQETKAQNQREKGVLKAVYPRPSAIPPNPSGLKDSEETIADDGNIPVVRLTPIEDDYPGVDPSLVPIISHLSSASSSSPHCQPDLIDHELLIRILSNPKMVEQLIMINTTSSSAKNMPSTTINHNLNIASNNSTQLNQTDSVAPKDISYYKSLVQQFGGGGETRKDVPQSGRRLNFKNSRDELRSSRKIMKPCSYFNSSKGCRKGDNCAYLHDIVPGKRRLDGFSVDQSMKRMKLNIGINAGA